jgi:hypothetical protein
VRGAGGLNELIDAHVDRADLVLKIHASFSGKTRDFTHRARERVGGRCKQDATTL